MYFEKAIDRNGAPDTVTMDKSGANLAALQTINFEGFKDSGAIASSSQALRRCT